MSSLETGKIIKILDEGKLQLWFME